MINKIETKTMGRSKLSWLESTFHFSFAEYYNPANMNFGNIRVINDDLIDPHSGFDLHPHKDMEIISYIINGELTHADSIGNEKSVARGSVQYMSAGKGIFHSEHNKTDETVRLLQIWILPDMKSYEPKYGDYTFDWNLRKNNWLHMVSSNEGNAPIKINQDVNFYSLELEEGKTIEFKTNKQRQSYLIQIEGTSTINNLALNTKDALEVIEEDIVITANSLSHFLVIEGKLI